MQDDHAIEVAMLRFILLQMVRDGARRASDPTTWLDSRRQELLSLMNERKGDRTLGFEQRRRLERNIEEFFAVASHGL
jgi:hypothetical protein